MRTPNDQLLADEVARPRTLEDEERVRRAARDLAVLRFLGATARLDARKRITHDVDGLPNGSAVGPCIEICDWKGGNCSYERVAGLHVDDSGPKAVIESCEPADDLRLDAVRAIDLRRWADAPVARFDSDDDEPAWIVGGACHCACEPTLGCTCVKTTHDDLGVPVTVPCDPLSTKETKMKKANLDATDPITAARARRDLVYGMVGRLTGAEVERLNAEAAEALYPSSRLDAEDDPIAAAIARRDAFLSGGWRMTDEERARFDAETIARRDALDARAGGMSLVATRYPSGRPAGSDTERADPIAASRAKREIALRDAWKTGG